MTEIAAAWPCEAYGPEGMAAGFWCFFSGEVTSWRDCGTEAVCHARMTGERVRVFDRLRELAAAGDDIAIAVLAEINSPAELLGGSPDVPNGIGATMPADNGRCS